jgi:hypothetical protein
VYAAEDEAAQKLRLRTLNKLGRDGEAASDEGAAQEDLGARENGADLCPGGGERRLLPQDTLTEMVKMRISKWTALAALGGLMLVSACGPGYGGLAVSARLGPGIDLYGYSAERDGDWHASYRQWTPTVVYEVNGQYYPANVRGGREVQVYRTQSGYVLPPRDQEWARTDKRFNAKKVPTDADYGRARPRP